MQQIVGNRQGSSPTPSELDWASSKINAISAQGQPNSSNILRELDPKIARIAAAILNPQTSDSIRRSQLKILSISAKTPELKKQAALVHLTTAISPHVGSQVKREALIALSQSSSAGVLCTAALKHACNTKNSPFRESATWLIDPVSQLNSDSSREALAESLKSTLPDSVKTKISTELCLKGDYRGLTRALGAINSNSMHWSDLGAINAMSNPVTQSLALLAYQAGSGSPAEVSKWSLGIKANTPKLTASYINKLASHKSLDAEQRVALSKLSERTGTLQKLGIHCLERFDENSLNTVIKDRQHGPAPGQPTVVFVAARWDQQEFNAARPFAGIGSKVQQFSEAGYHVTYLEASSKGEWLSAIREATAFKNGAATKPARVIYLAKHGEQDKFHLASPDLERNDSYISIRDMPEFKALGIGSALEHGGQIVLSSCSTGKGGNSSVNMANGLRKLFPQAAAGGIYAPTEDAATETLKLDQNGRIKDVKWNVPAYQASLRNSQQDKYRDLVLPIKIG